MQRSAMRELAFKLVYEIEVQKQLAEEQFEAIRSSTDNTYTATVGGQGIYNGNASLVKTVFVEDPDNLQIQDSVINMSKRYGVVGGIRTFYRRNNSSDKYVKVLNFKGNQAMNKEFWYFLSNYIPQKYSYNLLSDEEVRNFI